MNKSFNSNTCSEDSNKKVYRFPLYENYYLNNIPHHENKSKEKIPIVNFIS